METLQRTANRGSVSTGYDVANSVKFETDNSEFLTRDVSSAGSRTTSTVSVWLKRTEISTLQYIFEQGNTDNDDGRFFARFQTDDTLRIAGGSSVFLNTNRVFRDTSAWYHIVVTVSSADSTADDRIKLYINGVQETSFGTRNNPSSSATLGLNFQKQTIGSSHVDSTGYFAGYMTEIVGLDGTASAQTSFGEFDSDSGIWIPKSVSASGTNGFYLDFEDASNLGNDVSGGTDFTENNIAAADQATDTCTNNFATQNVLRQGSDRMPLMSEGATEIGNNVSAYRYSPATIGVSKGKWYWEIKPTVNGNTLVSGAGIASNETTLEFYGVTGNFVYHYDGDRYVNGSAVSSYGAAWSTNDIIGFAYDADNWTLTAYVNNSSQGNLLASQTDISSKLFIPYVYSFGTHTYQTNFGGYTTMSNTHTNTDANGYGSFVYAPPTGYYAICTKNLAEFG